MQDGGMCSRKAFHVKNCVRGTVLGNVLGAILSVREIGVVKQGPVAIKNQ